MSELLSSYDWIHKPRRSVQYLNMAASFDIETTSWRNGEGEKRANMYIWMVCLAGKSFYGRTWDEFVGFCDILTDVLRLDTEHRLCIYVHNLAFEFQFIKCLFDWEQVFALDVRVPVYACTMSGIEFRCSLILHGASLAHMAGDLHIFQLEKKTGDLDYDLLRHSETPLSETELGYCIADVQVVVAYIEEQIIAEKGRLTNIPLTKTGYPRRLVKRAMLYGPGGWHNRKLLEGMTYTKQEFLLQRWEFQGGFTHGNARHIGKRVDNVRSKDVTSDYPFQCLLPIFPMGKGKHIVPKDMAHFRRMLKSFCCLFRVRFTNVRPKPGVPDHIISFSKCKNIKDYILDNGRVVSCSEMETAFNEIDFASFERFYDYDTIEVREFYRYRRGYLPKAYIETVLQLYNDKTLLKEVEGREVDYQMAKENLNSLYGMMVTSPIRDEITYKEDWQRLLANWDDGIKKYNESKSRFISYNWGCWITAAARAKLYDAILSIGAEDFMYSDTDSVKYANFEAHEDYFTQHNKKVEEALHDMCEFYNLDFELCRPKGKLIGVWDDEGIFSFKTLGAKRYMVEKDGKLSITVSGLNKKKTVPWMLETFPDPWEAFNDGLDVPPEATGKLTHTYIDTAWSDMLTDYTGKTALVWEHSCVHLEPAEYSLSLAKEFLNYIHSFIGE